MFIENLKVVNFRNYTKAEVNFGNRKNFIFGLNAQGKTNLLEAIYIICLGRSFRLAGNKELIKTGTSFFTIEGRLNFENGINKDVVLYYVKDGKKEISIDRKKLKSNAEIIGNFPIVVMSPEDYKITYGSPRERRRFLDIILSQVNVIYLNNLQEYARILKQRNKILQSINKGIRVNESAIEPWTQNLINVGTKILQERHKFINEFSIVLSPIYRNYTNTEDELEVSIESTVPKSNNEPHAESFYYALKKLRNIERLLGVTLVGPHRDDVSFKINGLDIKKYGSRGEHKSVLISLRIAEYNFILQKKEERPIFLLDDFFSELDDLREKKVFNSLQGLGQIFLTSPKETDFNLNQRSVNKSVGFSRFYIKDGKIEQDI